MGGITAIVDCAHRQPQFSAISSLPSGLGNLIELRQRLRLLRIAVDLPVAQVPAFLTATPAPHGEHQPLVGGSASALHVNASSDQQHAIRHRAIRVTIASLDVFAALGKAVAGELAAYRILPRVT